MGRSLTLMAPLLVCAALAAFAQQNARPAAGGPSRPTFYRDVLPILQTHCQVCHRQGEIGPMPLVSYDQVRPFARAIAAAASARKMPPWFADPSVGHFANDPSLMPGEIATLASWADANAPAGDSQRRTSAPPSGPGLDDSPAGRRRSNAEARRNSCARRCGVHIRNRAHGIHFRTNGCSSLKCVLQAARTYIMR